MESPRGNKDRHPNHSAMPPVQSNQYILTEQQISNLINTWGLFATQTLVDHQRGFRLLMQ